MNDLAHFDPLTDLRAVRSAMRQFLVAGLTGPQVLVPSTLASLFVPVDLLDTGPDLVVRAARPGVTAEQLKITLSGSTLILKGAVETEPTYEDAVYLRRERRGAAFTRSLALPVGVEADSAHTVFRDDVLTLTLPKTEKVRPNTIRVTPA